MRWAFFAMGIGAGNRLGIGAGNSLDWRGQICKMGGAAAQFPAVIILSSSAGIRRSLTALPLVARRGGN
jgi:hypothetical protein